MTVGIVGAGITGLALHHYLDESGVESVVFESSGEPGGVIRSRHVADRVLECGPQRVRRSKPVGRLVSELGLEDELLTADDLPLYVYRDGSLRRVPFSLREALTTDLLSWRGKARALLEPLTGPPRAEETVEAFLTRTFGTEIATYLVGPLYAGIYASHPGEMPMKHSLLRALEKRDVSRSLLATAVRASRRRSELPPPITFADGLQTLPRALFEAHRDRVRLETPIEAVREDDGRYLLDSRSGTTAVDRVVLTTPAATTAELLDPIASEVAQNLRRLTYNPLAVVHLRAESDLAAAGYKIPFAAELRTLGVTSNAGLFGERGVHTCFLGGSQSPELVEWSDDRLGALAAREFTSVTGIDAEPLHVARCTPGMPAYDATWSALEGLSLPSGVHLCANYESRAGVPGRIRNARSLADRLAGSDANIPPQKA